MADEPKYDVTLTDGRGILFDFTTLTHTEWRQLFDPKQEEEEANELLSRISGVEVSGAMLEADYKTIVQGAVRAHNNPLPPRNLKS